MPVQVGISTWHQRRLELLGTAAGVELSALMVCVLGRAGLKAMWSLR